MRYTKLACVLSIYHINKANKQDKQVGGGNYRKIVVNGNTSEFDSFRKYAEKYKKELEERNVQILYKKSSKFLVELYGYDGELKKTFGKQDLDAILKTIDLMPMGKIEKSIRKIV